MHTYRVYLSCVSIVCIYRANRSPPPHTYHGQVWVVGSTTLARPTASLVLVPSRSAYGLVPHPRSVYGLARSGYVNPRSVYGLARSGYVNPRSAYGLAHSGYVNSRSF